MIERNKVLFISEIVLVCVNFHFDVISSCDNIRSGFEDQDCLNLLPADYKVYVAPQLNGAPITIKFFLNILDIDEINEGNMDFRLHGYLHNAWTDERLKMNNTSINNNGCYKYVWSPDIVFETAKTTQTFGIRNSYFYVSENKRIYTTQRYAFKIGCLMYFKDYPFDTQHCVFSITIMSHNASEVHIKWGNKTDLPPILLLKKIEPLQFFLKEPTVSSKNITYFYGNYTYLYVHIELARRLMGSIVNIYAPSTLVVAVSWVTFWLRVESAPARVSLSITSLLTLCTQVHQNKSQLPPLNYITAVDIWLFMCIFMVFSTLIEFAISYNTYVKVQKENGGENETNAVAISPSETKEENNIQQNSKVNSWIKNRIQNSAISERNSGLLKMRRCSCFCGALSNDEARMDVACRKLFPFTFFLFTFAYWMHYLSIYNNS